MTPMEAFRASIPAACRRLRRHPRRALPASYDRTAVWTFVALYAVATIAVALLLDRPVMRLHFITAGPLQPVWYWLEQIGKTDWMFAGLTLAGLLLSTRPARRVRRHHALVARWHANVMFAFVALAATGLSVVALKFSIGRARPLYAGPDFEDIYNPFTLDSTFASFPSGHATTAGCIAALVALMAPRWRTAALVGGFVFTTSRVMYGAHYPSDILAGYALGTGLTFWLAVELSRRNVMFELRPGRFLPTRLPRPLRYRAAANPRSRSSIRSDASSSPT